MSHLTGLKPPLDFAPLAARLNRVLKNSWCTAQSPSAAKAVDENKPVIAAVNRCATQKQEQN